MKLTLLSVFFFFTLSLSAQQADKGLRIFPNPVTTEFEVGSNIEVSTIRVLNMVGREVLSFEYAADKRYNVADLPRGMYLVQLKDIDDKVVHTQRIKKG